ncbi:MAG: type II toxin-antitoxin system RelE/ParE family toxin [Leptospira sp.]|nr:type II toxin-antitoxin system RelE/ParE family toxin [Leptospira sp.]
MKKVSNPYDDKIVSSIQSLATDPLPSGVKKLKGRDGYRIRSGDYRIVYTVNEMKKEIIILNIGHRKDVYR